MKRPSTEYLIVHCSATQADIDVGAREIREWHQARGWSDIGYHFVIRRNGTIERGRPLHDIGAHVMGYNDKSVGICLVGGLDKKRRPEANFEPEQMGSLRILLAGLLKRWPQAKVIGHRDVPGVAKACPCFDVNDWFQNGKKEIE